MELNEIHYRKVGANERNKILELWNSNIGCLFPIDERLFFGNLNMDMNLEEDGIVGAFYKDNLLGFIIIKRQLYDIGLTPPNKTLGNINSFIVDFNYRGMGIGSKLLAVSEEKFIKWGIHHVEIGRDRFHFFPGLPIEFKVGQTFLLKRGYKEEHTSWDMICDISSLDFKEVVENKQLKLNMEDRYVIEELNSNQVKKFLVFLEKSFSGRWYGDTRIFIDKKMQLKDIVVVYDKDKEEVIGFSHIYDENSSVLGPGIYWRELLGNGFGGLGPIGIDSDERKKKLGLTLLYKSLRILKTRGVRKMCIDWTDLIDFYDIFNFIPWKGYIHMGKDLELS